MEYYFTYSVLYGMMLTVFFNTAHIYISVPTLSIYQLGGSVVNYFTCVLAGQSKHNLHRHLKGTV